MLVGVRPDFDRLASDRRSLAAVGGREADRSSKVRKPASYFLRVRPELEVDM